MSAGKRWKSTPTLSAVLRHAEERADHFNVVWQSRMMRGDTRGAELAAEQSAQWVAWKERARQAWKALTPAQKKVAVRLAQGERALPVAFGNIHPAAARALVKHRLAFTWASGEYDPHGPCVSISALLDMTDPTISLATKEVP